MIGFNFKFKSFQIRKDFIFTSSLLSSANGVKFKTIGSLDCFNKSGLAGTEYIDDRINFGLQLP